MRHFWCGQEEKGGVKVVGLLSFWAMWSLSLKKGKISDWVVSFEAFLRVSDRSIPKLVRFVPYFCLYFPGNLCDGASSSVFPLSSLRCLFYPYESQQNPYRPEGVWFKEFLFFFLIK